MTNTLLPSKIPEHFIAPDLLPTTFKSQHKLLVNVDWLTLRLKDTLTGRKFDDDGVLHLKFHESNVANLIDEYRIEKLDYGTKLFNNIAKVYFGPDCIAEIQFGPRMSVLKDTMFIKYENWVFYDAAYMGQKDPYFHSGLFSRLFAALGTDCLGVTRCDICVDGVDFTRFINLFAQSDCYEQVKVSNVLPTAYSLKTKLFDGFTVGRRGGKKYAVCYNKTKEIADRGAKKQYITDYFKANGFDCSRDVYRFELRLNSEAFHDMQDFWFREGFFDTSYLISILEFQLVNFFEFVLSGNYSTDSRRSRRPKIQLFDFSNASTQFVRVKRVLLDCTRTAKVMVGRLVRDAYLEPDEHISYSHFTTARELCLRYHLEEWIVGRSGEMMEKTRKHARIRGIPIDKPFEFVPHRDIENFSLHFV